MTKEQLADEFLKHVRAVADTFEELGEILHPLENVLNGWQGTGEYLTESDLKSVSEKLTIIRKHISVMYKINQKYEEPRKTQIVNRKGVENVITKEDLLSQIVNNEVKEEGWFYNYQGELPTEFKQTQEAYKVFIIQVDCFYKAVEKDGFEHPPIVDLTKEKNE